MDQGAAERQRGLPHQGAASRAHTDREEVLHVEGPEAAYLSCTVRVPVRVELTPARVRYTVPHQRVEVVVQTADPR